MVSTSILVLAIAGVATQNLVSGQGRPNGLIGADIAPNVSADSKWSFGVFGYCVHSGTSKFCSKELDAATVFGDVEGGFVIKILYVTGLVLHGTGVACSMFPCAVASKGSLGHAASACIHCLASQFYMLAAAFIARNFILPDDVSWGSSWYLIWISWILLWPVACCSALESLGMDGNRKSLIISIGSMAAPASKIRIAPCLPTNG